MRSKGFTLIELLAVIVILAVIALIATPIILGIINDTKKQAFEVEAKNIENAAEYYLTIGLKIESVPKYREYYIPVSDLTNYLSNVKDEMLEESVIVKKTDNSINYYYTGRDNNPYLDNITLKQAVEGDTTHILNNKKINGITVNKVIGTKAEKKDIKNWVWYSGQLWQVLETHNDYVKLITANSVTSIAYGSNSTWSTSWARKWLNEIDSNSTQDGIYYNNLSRIDLLLEGQFCLDEPTGITEASNIVTAFTQINTCSSLSTDKIGLMSFEDYVYSEDGNGINGANGGSYIDENESSWTMTKYSQDSSTNRMWMTYYDDPSHIEHPFTTTNGTGIGLRPVIYLSSNLKLEDNSNNNYGTINNPYRLVGEQVSTNNYALNGVTIGTYIYLSETNNSYITTTETVTSRLSYSYDKTKVRYRVIGINSNGSIKVQRADVLRSLPSTISMNNSMFVPYYYKQNTCDYTAGVYTDCTNHNYFKPTEGSGAYAYTESENIAYYLNNADNSYYNWLSNSVKANIVSTNWNLPVGASAVDYITILFNTTYTGTYPSMSNDGVVTTNIGLPQWGYMFSGNDLNYPYWYINRWSSSSSGVSIVTSHGYTISSNIPYYWNAVRPVFNLSSTIKILSGDGTPANPYVLNI